MTNLSEDGSLPVEAPAPRATALAYSRTWNLGNFASERIELTVSFDPLDKDIELYGAVEAMRLVLDEMHKETVKLRSKGTIG